MSRRHSAVKRQVLPDPKFNDVIVTKFMNHLMVDGKKSVAERIVYGAFEKVEEKLKTPALSVFLEVLANVAPELEVKSRRIGGATFQVPIKVSEERGRTLAMKWVILYARKRSEDTMTDRLAAEIMDAHQNRGASIKKREDTHKMAEANKAFAHYR